MITNPCISSQVNDINLLPDDYTATGSTPTLEARVLAGSTSVFYYYDSPDIVRSSGFPAGYTDCGDTDHYLATYDSNAGTYSNYRAFHPSYKVENSLSFYQDTSYTPTRYYVELDPTQDLDLGRYEYGLIIEMSDYPSTGLDPVSGWASVTPEIMRFDVIINPCLVT